MNYKYCGIETNRPKFCCNKHKDKFHNEHNPRGIFAHLRHRYSMWEIEDDHSFEEEEIGIHEPL